MKRSMLSVIVGLVVAVVTFIIVEKLNGQLYPWPENMDFQNNEAVVNYFDGLPLVYWLIVLLGWIVGSLLCGFFIKFIMKSEVKSLPIIAGAILTLSAVANFMLLPHPTWIVVVGLVIFIPITLLGHSLYKLKTDGEQ